MSKNLTEGYAANTAWHEWAESLEGKKCLAGRTDGVFLKNRLATAFSKGWDAAKRHQPQKEQP